jgi:hypothetical protein
MKTSSLVTAFLAGAILTGLSSTPARGDSCANPEFAAARAFVAHEFPFVAAAADLNGDGVSDAAWVTFTSNVVSVALGHGDGTLGTNVDYASTIPSADSLVARDMTGNSNLDLVVFSSFGGAGVLRGNGNGMFQPMVTLTNIGNVLAVGDLNGDGIADVVTAAAVRLGHGDLSFGTNYLINVTGESPISGAIGDMNNDGIPDVVIGGSGVVTGHVWVALGHGDGTFEPAVASLATAYNSSLAIGDFDNDGTNDVAVLNSTLGSVNIYRSTGNGALGIRDFKTTGNPGPVTSNIRAVDADGDGNVDVVVGDFQIFVFRGNGDGTIQPSVKYNQPCIKVDIGDFNQDGIPDILAGSSFLEAYPNIRLLLGNGDGTFQNAPSYPTGKGPLAPVVADFNGDGKPDVAVANAFTNTLSVLLNHGDGTFGTNVNYFTGTNPQQIAVGDFNNDGKRDLIVANLNTNYVALLLGNGNGTFQPAINAASLLIGVGFVVAGDFNKDGKLDFAIPGLFGVSVYPGNNNGTFGAPINSSSAFLFDRAATGDLNNDGKLDLVVGQFGTNTVTFLLGNGNGTFQNPVTNFAGLGVYGVAIGDLNGDGKADIAVANFGCNVCNTIYPNGGVSVLLGNGNGTFQPAVFYLAHKSAAIDSVAIADVNGDGKPDLIAGASISPFVYVLLNNGNGTFAPGVPFGVQSTAFSSLAVGDLNANGKNDIVVACEASDVVSVLLNTCPFAGPTNSCPTITVSPASLPDGTVGVAYKQIITASGGAAPRTFAITTGNVPGLTLSGAGTLSGTPTTAGAFGFTITATDANDCTGSRSYLLTVNAGAPEIHNLALVKLKAPKKITFKSGVTTVTGKFAVSIQNRGAQNEVIPDFATLQTLVTVMVESLGECPDFPATMTLPKKTFPITLAPKKKLNLAFTASFTTECVHDPLPSPKSAPNPDYRSVAHVGLAGDADASDDDCPRGASALDKGCPEAYTDVIVK